MTALTDVLAAHWAGTTGHCSCGHPADTRPLHAMHQAEAIAAAGLVVESADKIERLRAALDEVVEIHRAVDQPFCGECIDMDEHPCETAKVAAAARAEAGER